LPTVRLDLEATAARFGRPTSGGRPASSSDHPGPSARASRPAPRSSPTWLLAQAAYPRTTVWHGGAIGDHAAQSRATSGSTTPARSSLGRSGGTKRRRLQSSGCPPARTATRIAVSQTLSTLARIQVQRRYNSLNHPTSAAAFGEWGSRSCAFNATPNGLPGGSCHASHARMQALAACPAR
jgi:hypothetical protein